MAGSHSHYIANHLRTAVVVLRKNGYPDQPTPTKKSRANRGATIHVCSLHKILSNTTIVKNIKRRRGYTMDNKDLKTSNLDEHILQAVKNEHPQTVKQLIELLYQEHALPKQEIMEHILDLQNQGKLTFKKDALLVPLTLKGYLISHHSYWYWIIITLALTTTTITSVFNTPENAYPLIYARYLLGSIFVLGLPGYSFIKALFPTKELDNMERIALSIGTSMVLVPIILLLVNYTTGGIKTSPVTFAILALTTVLATAGVIREHEAKLKERQ